MVPYLALCREDAQQREYPLRAVFNALRYVAKTGCQWRMLPNDLPPWQVVYQQMRRWIEAHCFETMIEDLRGLLREYACRRAQPTAMILDSRTLQSTPESGARGGYDGAKRRKRSKVHAAVDTLGHLLALHVTAADEQDRVHVGALAEAVQQVTGEHVELAYVDQGYTGEIAAESAAQHGSNSKSSSIPSLNVASCHCPDDGWWNAALHGRHAFGGWPETIYGSPKHLPRCTTWHSPSSCSVTSAVPSRKVNNRL